MNNIKIIIMSAYSMCVVCIHTYIRICIRVYMYEHWIITGPMKRVEPQL